MGTHLSLVSQSTMTSSVTSLSIMTTLVFMTRVTFGASLPNSLILPTETKCREYSKSISPSIAQNTNGQIKFIQQMNSTHVDVQRIDVVICEAPGSSCVSTSRMMMMFLTRSVSRDTACTLSGCSETRAEITSWTSSVFLTDVSVSR